MDRDKKIFLALMVTGVLLITPSVYASENYCHDRASWKEWEALAAQYPDDREIHTLHALRLGLCLKVERGDLTSEEATTIFEKARESILDKRTTESGHEKHGL